MGGNDPAIWKVELGKEQARFFSGAFSNPIVTPDGEWLVAIKILNDGKNTPQLIRHNMQTGQEFAIKLPQNGYFQPAMYVTAHAKVLLRNLEGAYGSRLASQNYLLDPETGMVQSVKGDFRPFENVGLRAMQPAENPNEFWAAIYDSRKNGTTVGRYDSKNFSFTPLFELPELRLISDDFWVDAAAGKIWITYQGQLLRVAMSAKTK
jgi:hypothetical protein